MKRRTAVNPKPSPTVARPTDVLLAPTERAFALGIREAQASVRALANAADREPSLQARREHQTALYRLCVEAGLHRIALSARSGGFALGWKSRYLVIEELARLDAGTAMAISGTSSVLATLESLGAPALVRTVLRPASKDSSGTWMLGSALAEPTVGADAMNFARPQRLRCTARPVAGGFELSGEKWMTTNGGIAAGSLVFAQRTGTSGVEGRMLVYVPTQAEGFQAEALEKRGLRSCSHAKLVFRRVKVPPHHVLLRSGPPDSSERRALHAAMLGAHIGDIAALALGVAQAAFELADEHVRQRQQSGSVLLEHPSIALRWSELSGKVAAARALIWQAGALADEQALELRTAAAARAYAVAAAQDVCAGTTDLLGSYGVLGGTLLDKLSRDAACLSTPVSTTDLLRILSAGV